jgi:short-subunit dehydrogenase
MGARSATGRGPLDGRRALVTGGSGGIGAAIALALASAGAHVAISGRDVGALDRQARAVDAALGATRAFAAGPALAAEPAAGCGEEAAPAIAAAPTSAPISSAAVTSAPVTSAPVTSAAISSTPVPAAAGSWGSPVPSLTAGDARATAIVTGRNRGTITIAADLRRPDAASGVVEAAVAELDGLDLVVSNAGIGWAGPMVDMTAAEIDDLVDLNLRAPLHLAHAALPHLCRQGRGHLVFVGSVAGRLGVPREVAYSATKAGLTGLTDALRSELAGTGVRVSLVTPGAVDTAFFEHRNRPYERVRPRPVPPSAVAAAVLDCIRRERAEVTVPGWVALPVRLHGAFPRIYRMLAERFA